jgi:hypothetical protein
MKWSHIAVLSITAILTGAMTWWCYDRGRLFDCAGILFMGALNFFFIWGDVAYEERCERDAKRAETERRDWDSY